MLARQIASQPFEPEVIYLILIFVDRKCPVATSKATRPGLQLINYWGCN